MFLQLLNTERYISSRILRKAEYKNTISKPIVKIGIGGIALGVAVMILTVAVVTGFQNEIIRKITGFTTHLQITAYDLNQSYEPNPVHLSDSLETAILNSGNVDYLQPYATKNGIIKTKSDNEGILLKGVTPAYRWEFIQSHLKEGHLPQLSDTAVSKDILISEDLARLLGLKLDQKIFIYFITKKKLTDTTLSGTPVITYEQRVRDLHICGIYNTGFTDIDHNLAFIDMKQIQRLNYWDSTQAGGYEVFLKDFSQLEPTTDQLNDLVGYDFQVVNVKQLQSPVFSWLDMVSVNGVIIVVLMVIVAGINMITALLILILERTNMVGLLKALGMSNGSVRSIFLHISLHLLGRGLLYGNLLGIGVCLLQVYFKPFTLDPATYYVEYVPLNFNLMHVLFINLGTLCTCMTMMFLPTLILTRITPVRAIRFS